MIVLLAVGLLAFELNTRKRRISCITRIEVLVMDLDAFRKACDDMDLKFVEGQKQYRTDDGHHKCDHAAQLVNGQTHELGLVRSRYDDRSKSIVVDDAGNGWSIMLDTFGRNGRAITARVGTKCETLLHSYGCHAVCNKATQMGWSLTEEQQADGSVVFGAAPKAMLQAGEGGSW